MKQWMSMIRNEKRYDQIMLCYIKDDVIAEKLYQGIGFIRKPEEDDGDELVMVYEL
ncbi:MAG TPA: hypothetical protein VK087_01205 [Tissierellaceae bacterium]|nr:hypothetical protein [Tissierellaceae bacterium]